MKTLLDTLIERDGLAIFDAEELISEAQERVLVYGEDPEEVLREEFGLEPDYIFDLLGFKPTRLEKKKR